MAVYTRNVGHGSHSISYGDWKNSDINITNEYGGRSASLDRETTRDLIEGSPTYYINGNPTLNVGKNAQLNVLDTKRLNG